MYKKAMKEQAKQRKNVEIEAKKRITESMRSHLRQKRKRTDTNSLAAATSGLLF